MNNFFLFKDALNVATLKDFENGINFLTEVLANKNEQTDAFIRYENFWEQNCVFGSFYEIPSKLNSEYIDLSIKLFDSFAPIKTDILNENDFDILYNNDCNGFEGFDFSATTIPTNRRVTDLTSFNQFKLRCANQNAYSSIQAFWNNKEILFPNLVFCDRVWSQIEHLSINDDRFDLINKKLKKLNAFAGTWDQGAFDYKNLGLDNSPDTPTRIANTIDLRTFHCSEIGDRVFSLHIKWSFGREFFRLYYYPNEGNRKVYIGYIGPKGDIGF
jgi:hypothetical protein